MRRDTKTHEVIVLNIVSDLVVKHIPLSIIISILLVLSGKIVWSIIAI
jgi:hypothetical protein